MPKRRRLLNTPVKNKSKLNNSKHDDENKEVSTARGRLKGALLEVLEPAEDSDVSEDYTPMKRERKSSAESSHKDPSSSEDEKGPASPPRQSYVLKLFDRSVDLSQFSEDSPLYPICRAWIANQPKANYKKFGARMKNLDSSEDSVELPGPKGPPITRVPKLLPEQEERGKEDINFDYSETPPPDAVSLLNGHVRRWAMVRRKWLEQAVKRESRYDDTQRMLNNISI